jgi:hypothetical protein
MKSRAKPVRMPARQIGKAVSDFLGAKTAAAVRQGLKESAEGKTVYLGSFAKYAAESHSKQPTGPLSVLGHARKLGRKKRTTAKWMRDLRTGQSSGTAIAAKHRARLKSATNAQRATLYAKDVLLFGSALTKFSTWQFGGTLGATCSIAKIIDAASCPPQ